MVTSQLHPGARWQFRIGKYLFFGFIGIIICAWIIISLKENLTNSIKEIILTSSIIYIIFAIVISEIYARMNYNRWFYEFTDDGLRLERGIIRKTYSNIPYERIQNVDIYRGIIARIFGFSNIMIQTAGYSMQPQAEGHIPAVDMNQAEQIRSFLMKKITNRRK